MKLTAERAKRSGYKSGCDRSLKWPALDFERGGWLYYGSCEPPLQTLPDTPSGLYPHHRRAIFPMTHTLLLPHPPMPTDHPPASSTPAQTLPPPPTKTTPRPTTRTTTTRSGSASRSTRRCKTTASTSTARRTTRTSS